MIWFAGKLIDIARRAARRVCMTPLRPLFGAHGRGFRFDPGGLYAYRNIYVGDDVNLGYRPVMMAAHSRIVIGSHVMFGPQVAVIAGNHNATVIGQFMVDVDLKTANDDLDVTIEDDVWIGARAVILRGVTIGRGAIVGAGSLVTKSVPPYAVVAGNPADIVRFRWDVATIVRHEQALYPSEKRYAREELQGLQAAACMLPPLRNHAKVQNVDGGGEPKSV